MSDMQDRIDEIMDNFDFAKVAKVMEFLDWGWRDEGVPDETKLRSTARMLLKSAASQDGNRTGTGGFEAINDGGCLTLEFVVAGYTAEPDDEDDTAIYTETGGEG